MMIVSRWIFAKFGWGMAALITPTVLLLTGAPARRRSPRQGWPGASDACAVPDRPCPDLPLPPPPSRTPPAGVIFFSLVLFSGPLEPSLAALGMTPLYAAVLVGAAQNIFSKSSKYSLFDPCKEMAYIPLDQETKVRRGGVQHWLVGWIGSGRE